MFVWIEEYPDLFYKENREFVRLKVVTAKEKKFRAQTKPKTVHQKILEDTKSRFTADVKLYLNIAVNQVKIAGHGASVENFNTTRIFFAPKNRNTVVNKIFKNLTSAEKADIELFMEQANVSILRASLLWMITI